MPDRIVNALDNARRQTLRLVDDLSGEQFYDEPHHGVHTPAWALGHLLLFDAYLADGLACDAVTIDQRWAAAFGADSTPRSADESVFSKDELLEQMDRIRSVLIARVAMMDPAHLDTPNPDDSMRPKIATVHDLLEYALWHEAYHAGQLSTWRKLMKLPQVGVAFLD
ncbi:MAG: DinB family protein [Planctomycetota bacterium]